MVNKITISNDEILFLKGQSGTVGIAKFAKEGHIFIGTPDKEEIAMFLEPKDIVAVSAINSSPVIEQGIKSLIFLLRDVGAPLVVLPPNHPTSNRLPMVASCGEKINLDCTITPGTHPEQDILCACEELSGIEIKGTDDGIEINGPLKDFKIEKI